MFGLETGSVQYLLELFSMEDPREIMDRGLPDSTHELALA